MGFNISGLVINKNLEDNVTELENQLGWNLEIVSEIDFETASSNWKDRGICDIYFSRKGTLVFIDMEMCMEEYNTLNFTNANTLAFVLSEGSMSFFLNYCENGLSKRAIMESNGELMHDEGIKFKTEVDEVDLSEVIWDQMEIILSKKFFDISLEEKATRYKLTKGEVKRSPKKRWWAFGI